MPDPSPEEKSLRVLVSAPFGRDAALLTRVLKDGAIAAEACPSIAALCETLNGGAGAILVAEESLTEDGLRRLAECVGSQEPWSDLPIFVMTRNGAEGRMRVASLEPLGNITILERPLRSATLVSAFRMGLRARAHQYQLRLRLQAEAEAARALRESERRYRTLAEAMPQLVWTTDGEGVCDYLSRQWLEYTGIPEEQQLGFGWLMQIHPDQRDATGSAWMTACRTGALYDVEYRLRRRDGEYRWFKSRAVPRRDAAGKLQKWFGSCTDIEDQKRVSEERRELLLREQNARGLAELLNRVGPMLLEELDSRRLSQKVTDLATELTGSEGGALLYKVKDGAEERYAAYARSGAASELETLPMPEDLQARTLVSADIHHDARFQDARFARTGVSTGDAKTAHFEVRSYLAAPLLSRSGEDMGALLFGSSQPGVFNDLHVKLAEGIAAQAAIALDNARLFSEAQQAQETLRQSNAELRRANEDLNQFAYSASHDLREPLRMIALYSQMLERRYRAVLDGPGAEYLNYVVQGAHRMEMLLRDLLDYTQVVSGHDDRSPVADANLVLRSVSANLQQTIKESEAEINFGELPELAVKPVHLLQLLHNLIANALKYRGAESPVIAISARQDGEMWRIGVADNGIGIEPQYARQVFGLFRRLHGSSQYEGTGIGLAICQKIVERYGGRIWVESAGEGRGCTFWFTLPSVIQAI